MRDYKSAKMKAFGSQYLWRQDLTEITDCVKSGNVIYVLFVVAEATKAPLSSLSNDFLNNVRIYKDGINSRLCTVEVTILTVRVYFRFT